VSARIFRLVKLEEDIDAIRRLGGFGARPVAGALKLHSKKDWNAAAVGHVLFDYYDTRSAPGRRSTGSPSEMTRRHSAHFTLYHLCYQLARKFTTHEAKCAAEAFEVYQFVATRLCAAKTHDKVIINIEAAMFIHDKAAMAEIKMARCRKCHALRLITKNHIATLFVCPDCAPPSRRGASANKEVEEELGALLKAVHQLEPHAEEPSPRSRPIRSHG